MKRSSTTARHGTEHRVICFPLGNASMNRVRVRVRAYERTSITHASSCATVCLPTPGYPLIRTIAPGMMCGVVECSVQMDNSWINVGWRWVMRSSRSIPENQRTEQPKEVNLLSQGEKGGIGVVVLGDRPHCV